MLLIWAVSYKLIAGTTVQAMRKRSRFIQYCYGCLWV